MINKKCYWCGKKLNTYFESDHFIPKFIGGEPYNKKNRVISCANCNSSKARNLWLKTIDGSILKFSIKPSKTKRFLKIEQDRVNDYAILTTIYIRKRTKKFITEFECSKFGVEDKGTNWIDIKWNLKL